MTAKDARDHLRVVRMVRKLASMLRDCVTAMLYDALTNTSYGPMIYSIEKNRYERHH